MKAGKEHRVPLSPRAIEILEATVGTTTGPSDLVFPGRNGAIGANVVARLLQNLVGSKVTLHGLRSTFRDWAAEQTSFPREVIEMALAHQTISKVEAAYLRSDLFEKRRRLMDAWAEYCAKPQASGKVVPIRA
jgi:integrase